MIKLDVSESLKPLETSITQLEQTIKDQRWSTGIAVPIICSVIVAVVGAAVTVSQIGG